MNSSKSSQYYVPMLLGSEKDLGQADKFKQALSRFMNQCRPSCNIEILVRICSAHKSPAALQEIMSVYNKLPEVLCYITVAGKSNALSAVTDGLTTKPVLSMPPLKNETWRDIFSSINLPTGVAPMLVLGAENCLLAMLKILSIVNPNLQESVGEYQKKRVTRMRILDSEEKYNSAVWEKMLTFPYPDTIMADTDSLQLQFVRNGKVRDIYTVNNPDQLFLECTQKLSCFDRNVCEVPYKGHVLNLISLWWFDQTKHMIPNHIIRPVSNTGVLVKKCEPIMIEFVMRSYMTGSTKTSIWVNYSQGVRDYCGNQLPEGLVKNQKLPEVLITPTTKGETDELISPAEIVAKGTMTQEEWDLCEKYARTLFAFGQQKALEKGLILVDTKYEFGRLPDGTILLIDEVHTPDSSRYWLDHSYEARFNNGESPENIDKDIIRKWVKQNYNPYEAESIVVPDEMIDTVSKRYLQLYDLIC